jgi:tetratricopeptide (TPR) repeat protein
MSTPRYRTRNNDVDRFLGDSFCDKDGIMAEELRGELRAARRRSGLTFAVFAQAAGYSESHLRSVENGTKPVTGDVARAYDRVLATGGRFGVSLAGPRGETAPWNRAGTLTVLMESARGGGVDRRSFLTISGTTLITLTGHWSSALAAAKSTTPTDPAPELGTEPRHELPPAEGISVFDHVEARLGYLRRLDDEFGSGEIALMARNELALLVRLLKRGGLTEAAESRAFSLASEATRQVAWCLFDSELHAATERYFEASLRASAAAGDVLAGTYAISFMAVQHYSAGNPRDAVNLLTAGEDHSRSVATPRMRAMLAARKGRALSKVGDRRACAHAINTARDLLDKGRSEDDPAWLYWVTRGEIEMIAGSSALELGDPAQALSCFNAAVKADYRGDDQYPRSHAIYLARAAEAHLALHDLDAAVAHARHAQKCLGGVDSARSSSTLAGLRKKLAGHAAHPAVRGFLQPRQPQ